MYLHTYVLHGLLDYSLAASALSLRLNYIYISMAEMELKDRNLNTISCCGFLHEFFFQTGG